MGQSMQGKVVLVAGLASGLGEVIARRFADHGAFLALSDPTSDVDMIARTIAEEHPGCETFAIAADFTDLRSCEAMVSAVTKKLGRIDALVIATVTLQKPGPLVSIEPDEWDRVMTFNVKGPYLLCKSVIPVLPRPGGAIGVVGSFRAQGGFQNAGLYDASKAAEMSLVRTLAVELAADGIRVNAIAPGYLRSNVDQKSLETRAQKLGMSVDEVRAARDLTIPMRRQAEASEVAEAMYFIMSPAASYMTGACLDVNGGLVIR
jgi:NAD(P)-dependent dehydrogenase (short-subunit alcohol dehydrogenase family)